MIPQAVLESSKFDASTLCELFQSLFAAGTRTQLRDGAAEPLYQPATSLNDFHCIYFTRDYFASALHEVAHWCIAGPTRRQRVDYGYWYAPDGRDAFQQQQFEQAEIKPQALEWMFCVAAGYRFQVSADNLNAAISISENFKQAIWQQTQTYCQIELPERGLQFATALRQFFAGGDFLKSDAYRRDFL